MEQQPVETRSWAVTRDGVAHELSVSAEGMTLRATEGDGVTHYAWDEVGIVEFPTPMTAELTVAGGPVRLGFHAGAVEREFRSALEELGVQTRTAPVPLPLPDVADLEGPAIGARASGYVDGAGWLVIGLALTLVGMMVYVITSNNAETATSEGVNGGYIIAGALLITGSTALSIAVVAIGVTVGLRRAADVMGPVSEWGRRRRS